MVRRLIAWPYQYPIGATAEFDPYTTGRDFGYSSLTTSGQTQRRDASGLSEAPSLG
jgi:hypothetical protein